MKVVESHGFAILTRINVETDHVRIDVALVGEEPVTLTEERAQQLRARLADAVEDAMASFWPDEEPQEVSCAA